MAKDFDDFEERVPKETNTKKAYLSVTAIILIIVLTLLYLAGVAVLSVLVFRKINACVTENSQQGDLSSTTRASTSSNRVTTTTTTVSTGFTVRTNKLTFPSIATIPPLTTTTTSSAIYEQLRLPPIYRVSSYNLKIKFSYSPNLRIKDGTGFNGTVDILFDLTSPTSQILFHADSQLQILDPIIIVNQNNPSDLTQLMNSDHRPVKNDYHFINSTRVFPIGSYKMTVSFLSQYQSLYENRGIFALTYLDDLNEKYFIIILYIDLNKIRRYFLTEEQ